MQEGDQEEEESVATIQSDSSVKTSCVESAGGSITSSALQIAYQNRLWALTGNYLKLPEVLGVVNPHLALIRLRWGRGRGRLLRQFERLRTKVIAG